MCKSGLSTLSNVADSDDVAVDRDPSEAKFQFTRKGFPHHVRGVAAGWSTLLLTAIASFGVMWGVAEAISYFIGADLKGWTSLISATVIALLTGVIRGVYTYSHRCPPGFEQEPPSAARLAHLQPTGWEFKLTEMLLEYKLRDLDAELQNLLDQRVFVTITSRPSAETYMEWTATRIENLERMVKIGVQLLTVGFVEAMAHNEDNRANPLHMLKHVDLIALYYAETVTFERQAHEIAPPHEFSKLHELHLGWSDVIRGGVKQLFDFMKCAGESVRNKQPMIEFTITVDAPHQIDEWQKEIDRLENDL
jgi:hypothetical protein